MRKTCTKRLEWDSAHRVMRHESKCSTLHGHRYAVEIECEADELDDVGRVVDFGMIKQRVGTWIDDHLDHTTIVNHEDDALRFFCEHEAVREGKRAPYVMDGEPTAENIAALLLNVASGLLSDMPITVVRVRVYETPTASAEVRP